MTGVKWGVAVTVVRSRIELPDGSPARHVKVTLRMLAVPRWLRDGTAKVLGTAATVTDVDGWWQLDIMPHPMFEEPDTVYAEITEHPGRRVGDLVYFLRVPDVPGPLLMRDLLVNPPEPPPPGWWPVSTLGSLHNVDRAADAAPDGSTLRSGPAGRWATVPLALLSLLDVDADSLGAAQPGDTLTLLDNGRWGAWHLAGPLALTWQPAPEPVTAVDVTVTGAGPGGAAVDFGDGTSADVRDGVPVRHTYQLTSGLARFTVTGTAKVDPTRQVTAAVTVKDHAPRVVPFIDGDDPMRVLVWIDEPDDGTVYDIDWRDTSPVDKVLARVPPHPRVGHTFAAAGSYPVQVTDTATRRATAATVDIGEAAIEFTFDGPARPVARMWWLKGGATWRLGWGDGSTPATGTVPQRNYVDVPRGADMPAGTYEVTLSELVDGIVRRTTHRHLVVPTQWDWSLDPWLAWRDRQAGPGRQELTVTLRHARVDCRIRWGLPGVPDTVVAPNAAASHVYPLPLPADGVLLRIEEISGVQPAHFQRLLAQPRYVGTPIQNGRSPFNVDLAVAGVDGPTNSDWYGTLWSDGSAANLVAAVGRWSTAVHRLPGLDGGTYTVAVDAPGMPDAVQRSIVARGYPTPALTAARDPADTTDRRTVAFTVDNRVASGGGGGPVLLSPGDGSAAVEMVETGSHSHRYPTAGTYTATGRAKADPTAQIRVEVTVPYPPPASTLDVTVAEDTSDTTRMTVMVTLHAATAGKDVQVGWGNGKTAPITVGQPVTEHYLDPDGYVIRVGYTDDSEAVTRLVEVPFTGRRTT